MSSRINYFNKLRSNIKKSKISNETNKKVAYHAFLTKLESLSFENEHELISFDDGIGFKLEIENNCNSIKFGFDQTSIATLEDSESNIIDKLQSIFSDVECNTVFLYSHNCSVLPFLVVDAIDLMRHLLQIMDLYENQVNFISADLRFYCFIDNDNTNHNGSYKIKILK